MTVDIDPTKAYWAEPIMYQGGDEKYLRYKITEDGISPLLFPPSDQVIKLPAMNMMNTAFPPKTHR